MKSKFILSLLAVSLVVTSSVYALVIIPSGAAITDPIVQGYATCTPGNCVIATATALNVYNSTTTNISSGGTTTITSVNNTFTSSTTNINSSSTVITGTTTVSSLILGSLTGFLKATAGVISATSSISLLTDVLDFLGISHGGTGTTTAPTLGQILVGNANGGYDYVSTSTLGNQIYASTSIGADVAGASATGIFFIDPTTGKLAQDTANFSYDPTTQKLKVTGGIDPVYFSAQGTSTNNNAYYEFYAGQNAATSTGGTVASSTGKIRYNSLTHIFEQSLNGGAWIPIGSGSGSSIASGTATNSTFRWNGSAWVEDAGFLSDGNGNTTSTNSTTTNFFSQFANFISAIINTLTAYTINSGTINATSSINTLVSNASTTNASTTNTDNLNATGAILTNATATNATITNLSVTNLSIPSIDVANGTITNSTSTNLYSQFANFLSSVINTLTAYTINSGTINATSSINSLVSNASTTNSSTTNAVTGNISTINSTTGNVTTINASTSNSSTTNTDTLNTNNFTLGTGTVASSSISWLNILQNLFATVATILNLNSTNATITNATTTNFASNNIFTGGLTATGTSALNILTVSDVSVLASTTPSTTTNALYNIGGNLYFNGAALGVAGAGTEWTHGNGFVRLATTSWLTVIGASATSTNDNLQVIGTAYVSGTSTLGTTSLNGNRIINLAGPVNNLDAANKSYVDSLIQGLSWQAPVINFATTSYASTTGDRYIISSGATGFSPCVLNNICQNTGVGVWSALVTPVATGTTVNVTGLGTSYTYNGSAWVSLGSSINHNTLVGLQGGNGIDQEYHLTYGEWNNLTTSTSQLSNLLTTGTSTFASTTITYGLNVLGTLWSNILAVLNLTADNATITNATTTNFAGANISATGTLINTGTTTLATTSITYSNILNGNATLTSATITNLQSNNFALATGTVASATITNLAGINSSITNSTTTNFFAVLLNVLNAIFGNSTTTNATTTGSFASTGISKLATTTIYNLLTLASSTIAGTDIGNSLIIQSATSSWSATSSALYNNNGVLYWNGSAVGTGSGGGSNFLTLSGATSSDSTSTAIRSGGLIIGTTSTSTTNATLLTEAISSTTIATLIRGAVGQLANLLQIQNASGTSLFTVATTGTQVASNLSVTGTTTLASSTATNLVIGSTTISNSTNLAIYNTLTQTLTGTISMFNGSTSATTTTIVAGVDLVVGDNFTIAGTTTVYTVTAVASTTQFIFTPASTATSTQVTVYRAPNTTLSINSVLGNVLAYFDRLGILNSSGVTLTSNGNIATTSNTIYNQGGQLYFNGNSVSSPFVSSSTGIVYNSSSTAALVFNSQPSISTTSNALYNQGGTLYWNGNQLASGLSTLQVIFDTNLALGQGIQLYNNNGVIHAASVVGTTSSVGNGVGSYSNQQIEATTASGYKISNVAWVGASTILSTFADATNIYARAATVSGNAPTYGTRVTVAAITSTELDGLIQMPRTGNKAVQLLQSVTTGAGNNGAVAMTLTGGTTVTNGTPVAMSPAVTNGSPSEVGVETGVNEFIMLAGVSNVIYYQVGDLSGNTITFGTQGTAYSGTAGTSYNQVAVDVIATTSATSTIVFTRYTGTSIFGKVCDINSTLNTMVNCGTEITLTSNSQASGFHKLTTYAPGKAALLYYDSTKGNNLTVQLLSASGNVLSTAGSATQITSGFTGTPTYLMDIISPVNNQLLIYTPIAGTSGATTNEVIPVSVSGTTLTVGSVTTIDPTGSQGNGTMDNIKASPDGTQFAVGFINEITNFYPRVAIGTMTTNSGTDYRSNYFGLVSSSSVANATGTVTLYGNIISNLSGLIAGATYYLDTAGQLTTSVTNYIAGKALSATQLSINAAQGITNSNTTTNVVASYYEAIMQTSQSTNLTLLDHVKFASTTISYGTDISLDSTSTYSNTTNAASLGRFTLKAGKTYKLTAYIPRVDFSTGSGEVSFQWFNSDASTTLNGANSPMSWAYNAGGGNISGSPSVSEIFTPTIDTRVELRIRDFAISSLSSIGAQDNQQKPHAIIEVISGNAAVTGQSVDYAQYKLSANQSIPVNGAIPFNTLITGNIPQVSSTTFQLSAGKTYLLSSNIVNASGGTALISAWVDITASTTIGVTGSPTADNGTAGLTGTQATAIFTPSVDTQVQIRNWDQGARTIQGSTSGTVQASSVTIQQLGTTATAEYSNNILGNFTTSQTIMSGTLSSYINHIQINQASTSLTLSIPNPTNTALSRIVYIDNTGTANFQMHGVTVGAGESAAFKWNGTTWKSFGNQANNVAAEYGENNSITDGQTVSTTIIDVAGSSFTLPTAGVWEVTYNVSVFSSAANEVTNLWLTDNTNATVTNTFAVTGINATTPSNGRYMLSQTARITTTGSATYKLRTINNIASGSSIKNQPSSQNTGSSKIIWNKISGYIPVSGQSVDYITAVQSATQSFGASDHFKFDTVLNGNIALDTTSSYVTTSNTASIGRFTLIAGKTYSLYASLGEVIITDTGQVSVQWYNADTGVAIGNPGQGVPASGGNFGGIPAIEAVFTPSVNTRVELRNTTADITATNSTGNRPYVRITQLGTSAFTSDSILSVGGNQFTTGSTSGYLSIGSLNNANINFIASSTTVGGFALATSSLNSASSSSVFFIGTSSPNSNLMYNIGLYIEQTIAKLAKRNVNGTDIGSALQIDSATSSVATTTNALYAINGLLYWNGMALNYGSTTATSSTQVAAAYIRAERAIATSTGLVVGTAMQFQTVTNQFGGDVVGNGGSATTTQFTLKAGKTYRLEGSFGTVNWTTAGTANATVNASAQWRNVTTGQLIGNIQSAALAAGGAATANTMEQGANGPATAIITPSSDTVVQLELTGVGGVVAFGQRYNNTGDSMPYAYIELIAGNAAVTGQSVDYIYGTQTVTSGAVTTGTAAFTTSSGNIPNTAGVFTLTAGKTYELRARLALAGASSGITAQWTDNTGAALIAGQGSAAIPGASTAYSLSAQDEIVLTYTATTNQQVRLNINSVSGSPTYSTPGGFVSIQQLGTTATTEYSNNILTNFTSSSTLNSTNILGASTTLLSSYINHFQIAQASSSIDLILPTPAVTTLSRIVYIDNTGTANFTMHGVTVGAGESVAFKWNGTTWKSFGNQAANVANETGSGGTIPTSTSTSLLTFTDLFGGNVTLPTAGKWLVTYNVIGSNATAGNGGTAKLVDSSNVDVAGSYSRGGSAAVGTRFNLNGSAYITTTGPATYKLQVASIGGATALTIYNDSVGQSANSGITYQKVSGYLPVIGQSVDYAQLTQIESQTTGNIPAANTSANPVSTIIFKNGTGSANNPTLQGNIPYNTTSGQFTLTAGKTYRLKANVQSSSVSSNMTFQWVDYTNNVLLGAASQLVITTTSTYGGTDVMAIVTPTTNMNVGVQIIDKTLAGAIGTSAISRWSVVEITQLGNSAFTSASILANGGNLGTGATMGTLDNNNVLFIASTSQVMALLSNSSSTQINTALSFTAGTSITSGGNDLLLSNASLVRISTSTAITITGFLSTSNGSSTGVIDGRIVYLMNTSTTTTVTLANQSSLSATSSRITTGTGSDLSMAAGSSITMMYDSANTTWRIIGGSGGGSGTFVDTTTYLASARLYKNSAQNITSNGTDIQITSMTHDFSTYGLIATSSSQITITQAGTYRITGQVTQDSNASTNSYGTRVYINGVSAGESNVTAGATGIQSIPVTFTKKLAVGDVLRLYGYNTVTSATAITTGSKSTFLEVVQMADSEGSSAGQMVDFINVTRTTAQTVADLSPVLFLNNITGNIPYNSATGEFTLTAGKTYKLEAGLRMDNTTSANWRWATSAGAALSSSAGACVTKSADSGDSSGLQETCIIIYTPTVDTNVRVQNISGSSKVIIADSIGATYAIITQLGSSAITSGTVWGIGGNTLTTTGIAQSFGTLTDNAIAFVASSTEYMRLLSTGQFLLGTTTATSSTLFVQGTTTVRTLPGTVTTVLNSTGITGSGTNFLRDLAPGQLFNISGTTTVFTVATITSATVMNVSAPVTGVLTAQTVTTENAPLTFANAVGRVLAYFGANGGLGIGTSTNIYGNALTDGITLGTRRTNGTDWGATLVIASATSTTNFATTTSGLYNVGGTLYWNGGEVAVASPNSTTTALILSKSFGSIISARNGSSTLAQYTNFSGGIGTGGNNTLPGALRITNTGNLKNIGSIDAGSLFLTGGGVRFASGTAVAVGTTQQGVTIGDVNGDGKNDIITSNSGTNISVLLATGGGNFAAAVNYTTSAQTTKAKLADVNGDGKLDIVTSNFSTNTVGVFTNKGDGTFNTQVTYSSGGTSPNGLALGDINGDGKADIVVSNSGLTTLLLNRGDGTFASSTAISNQGGNDVAIADINSDGRADVISHNGTQVIGVINTGNSTWLAPFGLSPTGASVTGLAVADFTGDGILDIISASAGTANVSLFTGTGVGNSTGLFTGPTTITTNSANIYMASADFNGDGLPDIVTSGNGNVNGSILINNGNGIFAPFTTFTTSGSTFQYNIDAGDLNGDGRADFVVNNYSGGTMVNVFMNIATKYLRASGANNTLSLSGKFTSGNVDLNAANIVVNSAQSSQTYGAATNVNSVIWASELGLFVSTNNNGAGNVRTSPDGITWTVRTTDAAQAGAIVWAPEISTFVKLQLGALQSLQTSPDAITWTTRTNVLPVSASWSDVTWSPELRLFVAVSAGGNIATSPDGTTWTARTNPAGGAWKKVVWSGELGIFLIAGEGQAVTTGYYLTSPDGITWTQRSGSGYTLGGGGFGAHGLSWSPKLGLFLHTFANPGGTFSEISRDGITWTSTSPSSANSFAANFWAASIGTFFMIPTTGNTYYTSVDGTNWTTRTLSATKTWTAGAWSPEMGMYVLSNSSGVSAGAIYTSANVNAINLTASSSVRYLSGSLQIGNGSGSANDGCLVGFGGNTISGVCSSDSRLKTAINSISSLWEKFTKLDFVTYNWNATATAIYAKNADLINTGVIAQQVENLFPELVTTDSNGYKQVDYSTLSMYGLKATAENGQMIASTTEDLASTTNSVLALQGDMANINSSIATLSGLASTTNNLVATVNDLSSTTNSLSQTVNANASTTNTLFANLTNMFTSLNNNLFGTTTESKISIEEITASSTISVDAKLKALGVNTKDLNDMLEQLSSSTSATSSTIVTPATYDASGTVVTATSSVTEVSFIGRVIDRVIAEVKTYLATAQEVFIGKVKTNEICITKTDGTPVCLNADQLEGIKNSLNNPSSGGGQSSGETPAPLTCELPQVLDSTGTVCETPAEQPPVFDPASCALMTPAQNVNVENTACEPAQ